jgi:hypothetical protein
MSALSSRIRRSHGKLIVLQHYPNLRYNRIKVSGKIDEETQNFIFELNKEYAKMNKDFGDDLYTLTKRHMIVEEPSLIEKLEQYLRSKGREFVHKQATMVA